MMVLDRNFVDMHRLMPQHLPYTNGWGVMCMGDKSPKSKERSRQQASAEKQHKDALAKSRAPISAASVAKKK